MCVCVCVCVFSIEMLKSNSDIGKSLRSKSSRLSGNIK